MQRRREKERGKKTNFVGFLGRRTQTDKHHFWFRLQLEEKVEEDWEIGSKIDEDGVECSIGNGAVFENVRISENS